MKQAGSSIYLELIPVMDLLRFCCSRTQPMRLHQQRFALHMSSSFLYEETPGSENETNIVVPTAKQPVCVYVVHSMPQIY